MESRTVLLYWKAELFLVTGSILTHSDWLYKDQASLHQKRMGRPPLSNQSRKSTKQNHERSQKCDNPQCVNPKHSGKHKMPFVLKIKLKMSLDLKNETQCLSCGRAINTYG